MKRPMVRIYTTVDEFIDREMTNAEFTKYQAEQELEAQRQAEAEAKATAKVALLAQLGITEEQAKLLLS